jgi:hypothetical protein
LDLPSARRQGGREALEYSFIYLPVQLGKRLVWFRKGTIRQATDQPGQALLRFSVESPALWTH